MTRSPSIAHRTTVKTIMFPLDHTSITTGTWSSSGFDKTIRFPQLETTPVINPLTETVPANQSVFHETLQQLQQPLKA